MQVRRDLEQHIAVFGERGSGKTVLLSSFYGAAQEPQFEQQSLFNVVADNPGQGDRLHGNYLGMKRAARVPATTKFIAASYAFSLKFRDGNSEAARNHPFTGLRLVWHDYPGEWFQQDVSGPEEARRRLEAFRALLGSDVALLLVDGQKLLDHPGEEERYLKSLLGNVKNMLLKLKDDLLRAGKLVQFPRIWILALSKADVLPEMDVIEFKELLIEKVAGEIDQLRKVLKGFVKGPEAMSAFEDFLLLSSAKFGETKIDVTKRVGLDLIVPLAGMLPLERHTKWAQPGNNIPPSVVNALLDGVGPLAKVLLTVSRNAPLPIIGVVLDLFGNSLLDLLNQAVEMERERLIEVNAKAMEKKDYLRAALTRFRLDLDRGEEEKLLVRSLR